MRWIRKLSTRTSLGVAVGFILAIVVTTYIVVSCTRRDEPAPDVPPPVLPAPQPSPTKTDEVLARLQPGMLRVDVEAILGTPASVESVKTSGGRPLYRATFNRDRLRPPLPPLILEFDASKTGHPLVRASLSEQTR